MVITVQKRNGELAIFDKNKVILAIEKANAEVREEEKALDYEIEGIVDSIKAKYGKEGFCTVEEIQDLVEKGLMEYGRYKLAKKYIIYRHTHSMIRRANTTDETVLSLVQNDNEEVARENSNKNATLNSTQRDLIAGEVSKDLSQRVLLPEKLTKAHKEGVLHFHDMDYFIQPMFNCFSREEKFITSLGVKSFLDFNDGDKVVVPTHTGEWKSATVRKYQAQSLYKVSFINGKTVKNVCCTRNHRWILRDGTVTTELEVGNSLLLAPSINNFNYSELSSTSKFYWCLGFVLGDGTEYHNPTGSYGCRLRLCKNKGRYAERFAECGFSTNAIPSYNGDIHIIMPNVRKQEFLDNKEWNTLNSEELKALINGLICADGETYKSRIRGISTADVRIKELLESCLEVAGYYVGKIRVDKNATNHKKDRTLYHIQVREFDTINHPWKVLSIEDSGRVEPVWCLEVEDNNSFILHNGIVTGNCCLVNIKDMLDNGTVMNGKLVESPKSFQVACTVLTQFIASIASGQYGGQSVDVRHLGKYLRKSKEKYRKARIEDGITDEALLERVVNSELKKELAAGVQTIQYQINTLMTTNGQSPFVTLFLNLDPTDEYIEENAMIIEEILRQRLEGIKNEKGVYVTPAFPKLIYVLDEHNCLKGGKYDYLTKLAVKCSAKRMYPDYISAKKMRENYEGEVFSCMGCRSFLSAWKDENGNFKWEGRFNQGVVSLNLPQIGILARGNEMKFWQLLDERLSLCFEALMVRHNRLLGTPSDVSPIHWQYGGIARLEKGEKIDKLLKDGYSTISLGYIGLYEVTKLMTGYSHTDKENGLPFALKVMNYLRSTCDRWKAATGLGFGLYGTPAESLCYRFARIDKSRFGEIEDVTDKGYYTNSYHVDVREKINAFDKLSFESQFQTISSGGAISYVEIPNMTKNLEALETLVAFIYDNIQYAEFNTKSDYCLTCGFDGEIMINDDAEWECPNCGNKDHSKMNVTRRTCGYLGENFFNYGKTLEIKNRRTHI